MSIVCHETARTGVPASTPEIVLPSGEGIPRYARGGYDVIVDGIIGPWFLKPWQSLVREHYEVHYIILRASKEETLKRAVEPKDKYRIGRNHVGAIFQFGNL